MPDDKQDAEKYRIFQEADQRYAAKYVERAGIAIVWAMGLAVIAAFMKLVLKI